MQYAINVLSVLHYVMQYELHYVASCVVHHVSNHFLSFTVTGEPWMALIKRGDCFFSEKLNNAVNNHGANGFIIYNDDDIANPKVIMNITSKT